jgi:hypothetical protein
MRDRMMKPKHQAMVWKRKVVPAVLAVVSSPLLFRDMVWKPKVMLVALEVARLAS